jgi:small-conductance mechanosensitive channel
MNMTLSEIFETIKNIMHFQLFELNQTPVTPMSIVMFLLLLLLFALLSRILRKLLLTKVLTYLKLDTGTSYTFTRIVHYFVMIVGVVVAFQFVGINLGGLAIIFGFLSVGIGFGLQNITSNFVSGLILLFERPIQVGDRVSVGDTEGDVEEINIRSTTIRSVDNISIIVPNSDFISSNVVNWSHGDTRVRLNINVGVSYNSDLDTVLRALKEVADENPEVLEKPAPEVHLTGFGDSSWDMQLRIWIDNPKRYRYVRSNINCAIVRKFRENNVEIPFPQRDLHVRTPLPLPITGGAN